MYIHSPMATTNVYKMLAKVFFTAHLKATITTITVASTASHHC